MKQLFALLALLVQFILVFPQQEELRDLEINPTLYQTTKRFQTPAHQLRYLVDKSNVIVTTDTLSLPFVDDFSTNRLRSYKWVENHITDTFYNVFGTCLGNEGINTIPGRFMIDTSWRYVYIDSLHKIDTIANAPISFTFFGPSPTGCFQQSPQQLTYWPEYYTYTIDTSGRLGDSSLVVDPVNHIADSIYYAPVVYFATGDSGKLWFDNYAYHNYTYPINPPTIGVATLDGLNEFGLPYNNANTSTYGTADYLTSLPINLSSIQANDTTVYLSFFYEAEGLGDYPDEEDSLIVEFKDNSNNWRMVWSDTGYTSINFVPQQFKQVLVNVPILPAPYNYFHNAFQFRFRNKASLYGNNDHWHIDYVRFDKNRSDTATAIQDIAFVYPFPTILKDFTLLPADQFSGSADLRDTITFTIHNLDPNANNNPPATNFVTGAEELYPSPGVIIAPDVLQTFNAGEYSYVHISPSTDYSNLPTTAVDSLVLLSKVTIDPNDVRPQNDTLYHIQNFNSVIAYDDGSAEKSYGISGLGTKKFAYEFNLRQPDTIVAFQVQFAQVDQNVSDLVFNFNIWDSLRMNDMTFHDTAKYTLENKKPFYIDSVNGFTTYKLDTPLIDSGKVYIGWTQTDTRRLQIGYDLNSTLGKPHMFIFTGTTWKPSTLSTYGSPMIRLIFDTNFWGGTSLVSEVTKEEDLIRLFPNPTTGMVYVRKENQNTPLELSVINMMGQVVKYDNAVNDRIDLSELQNGIYLLSLKNIVTAKTYHHKIIKTTF